MFREIHDYFRFSRFVATLGDGGDGGGGGSSSSTSSLPLDVICMSDVVTLHLFISVVQHNDSGNKVDDFTGR